MITSKDIAFSIAWIRCIHKELGKNPCIPCTSRFRHKIEDDVDMSAIISVAKYLEPSTRNIENITPLMWAHAYDIVKLVLEAMKRGDQNTLSG